MIARALVSGAAAAVATTLVAAIAGRRATGSYAAALNATSHFLRDGAIVSAVAYVTDYHLVPERLTPGFELRLRPAALAAIYAALALGLAARDVVRRGPA